MADEDTSSSAVQPSSSSQIPQKHSGFTTTTISTISLQSGETRLVIALLQSQECLQLKVLEGAPEITQLGATLSEALAFQGQHEEVLLQLQSKQSPVEELLRQADQLISAQRPRAEVYAAMAESLGVAWKDVNSHMELRKHILELNVAYQSRAEECMERMLALDTACRDTNVPVDIEAVQHLLARLHDLKRMMLEALMVTLQNGRILHEKISDIAAQGTLDSRPAKISSAANFTISQIEHWLEDLHDRRKVLEIKWQSRKTQLEQCLSLSLLAKDLKELDELLFIRKESLQNTDMQLGDSASSAELILHEHKKLINEAREFQDRCLKITKATEKLTFGGHFAGEQATIQAYAVLSSSVEYLETLEERDSLLKQCVSFFRSSRTTLTKLDQLEIQLTTIDNSLTNSKLVELHFKVSKSLEEIISQPLQQGYSLLEAVGHTAFGAQGVKSTIQELENRKITLDNLCTAHKEENVHLSKTFTEFLEKQNELYSWLVSIAEAFLQGHQDMGSVLAMADDFMQLHQQLLKDLQNKGIEINDVLLTLPPILEKVNDVQRLDIDEKVDTLHSHWLSLKSLLESRIDLAYLYVKFHSLSVELTNDFDAIEVEFRKGTDEEEEEEKEKEEEMMNRIEQNWLHIQQVIGQLTNLGKLFTEESIKIGDPYLDVKRACLCVETLLEHFANRQLVISQSWGTWQTNITTEREFNVLWDRNIRESNRIMDWISKLHCELYPILTGECTGAKIITKELEEKLQTILPELKRAQTEIELRVKTAETLAMKGEYHGKKEATISKLMELHNELNDSATDYQILLQMLISFFKKMCEVEKTVESLQSQYHMTRLPNVCSELDLLIKEHESSDQTLIELFRFTQSESEQIINRIIQQEPEEASHHDTRRVTTLLEDKKITWKRAWDARKLLLEEQQHICQFDSDLEQINSNISDLSKQLNTLKGQYGESLSRAKATSVAFVYFEETIQMLEIRIQTFLNTTEQILKSEYNSSHVESKLNELETKWSDFMSQVKKTRHLIDTNIEYFTLVEEAEEWFRIGSKLLITIARKSTAVRRPQAADQLLTEVEDFLKDDELLQQERINKISRLAEELYGDEASKQVILVRNEKKEMVDSFTIIRKELHVLAQNLRAAEEQRERQKKEMEETEAILATAKAEATAAKAAAAAAEEARRAAETAAKILQDAMPIIEKVEAETAVIPRSMVKENERLRKTSSPPSKRVKVSDEIEISRAPSFIVPLQDATVQEGQRFTFECRVTGFPVPGVTWHKDGISIQDNPDYRTSYAEGICTLAIEETFSEDSARFTCKATNTEGSAQSSATLSVQEAEPEEQLFPPVFIKRIEERSAKEGSTLFLMCTVKGNPLPTVQWFKNTMCIDSSSDYIITYNNGEAVIKFEEVFLEDQAEYSCQASNPLGTVKCSAKLIVEPLESTEAPLFISQLSNIMARAGGKIQLECEARGLPMPELIWTHNDKIIKDSQDIKLQYENGKGVLTIKEAFPKDAGIYRTVAKNVAGEATCSCNVSVKGRLPTETSDSEIASDFEPIKPSIHLSLKDIFVLEGQQVSLECIIVGQPEPEVIWYHNNHPVKESSDFQLLFQGDRCSLVIHEAYLEDAGEYKVVAINSGGEACSKCDLTVKTLCDSEPVTNSQQIDVTEVLRGTPPKFSKLVTDIFAYEGDQVAIECSVLGHPKPNIKWFLNNQEITDVISKEFKEDAERNVSLILPHVSSQDKGIYTIRASNSFGEAECSSNLMVKPVQSQKTQSCVEMQANIPPSFKEIFTDRKVPENTGIKFQCTVTGKPTPKVLWLINNKQISGNDVLISTSGEEQVLIIQNVRKINSGNVTCVAENDAGKASCSARLEVVDSENVLNESTCSELPATEDIESSCLSTKQSIFSSQEFKCQSSPTTLIRESESNMTEHVIPCSEQNFQELERKSVQVQSLKFQEVYQIKSERLDAERQSSTTSRDREESQDSSVSTYVTPTASPRFVRKSVAPRFISPLNGKIVDENAQVVLQGIIDGYPPPTVSWTKNGQELISVEGKLSINYDHNKVEVIVENATVQDAGQYSCMAENNVGCSSSTADVVIKKTGLPPVFGRRLHAQSVEEGGRVVMEVEITGIPDPLVSWYRNGQQIFTSDIGSSFRSKVQGISYLLVIDKVSLDHSGQYLVKAVNSKGEATSMADIVVNKPESQLGTMKEVIQDDISESKMEKLAQPQTPVSEAAAEIQHHPVTSSHSQTLSSFTNSSFMTATRIISQTTKTEKQTAKLGHTPFLISLRPEASYELLNEHTIPTQEETKVKMSILPNLPISSTEEFKTEFHTNQVERNILSPLLHTVSVKETQKKVESQSATENVGQLKVDGKVQVTSTDQNERKEMPVDEEGHIYQEDKSINGESSISNYKSLSPSEIQSDVKTKYIDIKNKREEPQESAIKSAVVNEESVVVTTKIREESGVETASVSKKKAYEFFINKIKEYEEENIKPVRKPIKLPTQEVQIFKGSSQTGIGHESHDKTEDCLGIPSALDLMSHFEPMISQVHSEQRTNRKSGKHVDHQHQLLSDSFVEELCVRHELPPENINISKSEIIVKSGDDAITRIKELEEAHQVLPHTGVPNGDSSIFPASVPEDMVKQSPCITPGIMEENITKEEADPLSLDALEHLKEKTTCKELLTDVFKSASSVTATTFTQPLIISAVTHLEPLSAKFRGIQTHTPKVSPMEPHTPVTVSTLQTQTESLATTAVPAFNSRHISEAVNQETHLPVQLVPFESFQLVTPKTSSEGLVMEKWLTPFKSKSELFFQTSFPIENSSDFVRDVSPRYSIEGSSVNKLWIPETRELEISIPNSFSVDSKKNDGAVSPKPSIEGLAMDKLWAHKHSDSSLKKVWPPPQHSENKPVMPWTTKFASDKIQYTVESAVDKREEMNLISCISATKDVSKSVPMPSPNPNIMKRSETKLFPLEINQPSPTLALEESHQPPIILTSGPASDSSALNLIHPTSKPPPAAHYIPNASVIHSAAVVDNEIHTTEMFTNTEIEEKIEVSKSFKHEITNVSAPVGDKIKQHEDMKICPSDSNESFQTKLFSAVGVSAPYQKVGPPSVSVILKEKFEKNLEVKSHDNKKELPKTLSIIEKQPFWYPDLEPSFFQSETTKNKLIPCPPPPKPSKFIKGEFMGSDYESDFDSHIPSKWRPYESDTEELSYRRVKPPSFIYSQRPKSTESSPLPPCCFEKPLASIGLLRPIVDKVLKDVKEIKSTPINKTISALETNSDAKPKFEIEKKQQTNKSSERDSPGLLKPGSPPEYVQPMTVSKAQESLHHIIKSDTLSSIKNKLDSPKSKTKCSKGEFPESGYMADTDEPGQFKYTHLKSTIKHEESLKTAVEKTTLIAGKTSQQNSQIIAQTHTHKPHRELQIISQTYSQSQQHYYDNHHLHKSQQKASISEKTSPYKLHPAKFHHKYLDTKYDQKGLTATGSTKSKELISTITSEVSVIEEPKEQRNSPCKLSPLSPYLIKNVRQTHPSPSKFFKGEFRESDYESDYESRIPPKWKPADSDADEPKYKPVHPVLSQKEFLQPLLCGDRTPTPPTEFDKPPEFRGPPRPKFEPIEKPSQTFKMDVIHKSSVHHQRVFKPKPVTPRTVPPILTLDVKLKESEILKPGPRPEMGYSQTPPNPKVNIAPSQKAEQIETSKVMNFAESTEHIHRVANVQETTHIIKFQEKEKDIFHSKPEGFSFTTDSKKYINKRPLLSVPKKFVPGDFYESEYESDLESVKIKPKWTPGNSDTEEPLYRSVRPPKVTSSHRVLADTSEINTSQTVSKESNLTAVSTNITQATAMQRSEVQQKNEYSVVKVQNDKRCKNEQNGVSLPVAKEMIPQQNIQLVPGEPPEFCYTGDITSVTSYVTSKHMSDMKNTFRSKAQQFASDIITDVTNSRQNVQQEKLTSKQVDSPGTGHEKVSDDTQAYREESRIAEYGTKHIDPETGLIYFKYDFGYEFGIVFPHEGRKQEGSRSKYSQIVPKQTEDIEVPVIHEKNIKGNENMTRRGTDTIINSGSSKVPQFKPKKFTHFKSVKWDPASESEMSEVEGDFSKLKKADSLPQSRPAIQIAPHIHIPCTSHWEPTPPSPLSLSLSPSLPSLSPCTGPVLDSTASPGGSWQGLSPNKSPRVGYGQGNTPTPPSTPSTPGSTAAPLSQQLCKPPTFITTLRDIAVMKGQTVCFECIVQAEPPPNILWAKDGRLLENSKKHQIHFRNGVCRLTLSHTYPEDNGNYTCTATNKLGTVKTSGLLQVPGETCFLNK